MSVLSYVEWDIQPPPARHIRTPVYDELPATAGDVGRAGFIVGETAAVKGEVGPPHGYYVWAGPKGWYRSGSDNREGVA